MAKASQADIDMALDLISVLDDIERGYFPYRFSDHESESTEWIDTDDNEQYERLIENLKRLLNRGSIGRVIIGMAVVCDPSNECIDPDADCIEHHPKRQRLEKRERRCSMSHADKALAAILEYDRLMSAINDCRKIISNPANECDRAVTVEEWTYILDNKHSHIQEVLAGFIDSDGYAPEHRHFHRDEALEIIGDCEGCLKVFEAIQERKRLKAKLGSTKRTIRLIARNAMKGCAA